jgi:hypothetical protein
MLPLCDSFGENAVSPSTCSGNFLPKKICPDHVAFGL